MKRNPKFERRIFHIVSLARAAELTGMTPVSLQKQVAAGKI